jgi:hypothetical protein
MKLLIMLFFMLTFRQEAMCPAYPIVRNGLAAFEAGVTQIGPYTDVESYLAGGIEYIRLACGDEAADRF